jgi:subtilisin family serine protease
MRLKTILGTGVVVALAALGTSAANAAPVPAAGPTGATGTGMPRTVTLITGDRVTVYPGRRVSVATGTGRAGISFLTRTAHGHVRVVPSDASALLAAGRLDPRLFDVTTLLGFGYDDRRAGLPLIVTGDAGHHPMAFGATVRRTLPAVDGIALTEPRTGAGTFWARLAAGPAVTVWLDGVRHLTDDVSGPQIGAPQAHAAGYTGTGVTVAVVDSGIDASHPDLAGKIVAEQNFTGDGDALDHVGHGTHVASTIAGSGAASDGRYAGIAPDAKLFDAKVCTADGCDESAIIAGMQWAAADQHAAIVNMSLGGPDSPGLDPVEQAVQDLSARYGTLFVVAAGNDGADGSVESPATADAALAVGAVDRTDALADFSSRGPRTGDDGIKPEITAPGVDITAARSRDGILGNPGDLYVTLSGTSMATPHVSGSAALLRQQHPTWSGAQLKAALMAAAKPNPTIGVYAQGAGRVDIGRGVSQAVLASPASLGFGFVPFPHTGDKPRSQPVSYHNFSASAVTLTLTTPASPVFSVAPSTVTVPAGGDASVTVTVDTRVGPDGRLGGELTASGGGVVVQTPVAVVKEPPAYDVTFTQLDRAGRPASVYDTTLLGLEGNGDYTLDDPSGTGTLRVPPGRYLLVSTIQGGTDPNRTFSLLAQPVFTVSRTTSMTIDARKAKRISVTIPNPGATPVMSDVGFSQDLGDGSFFSDLVIGTGFAGRYAAQLGPDTTTPGFLAVVHGQWAKATPDGTFRNSPYAYAVSFYDKGKLFTGLTRNVAAKDLATIHLSAAREATGVTGGIVLSGSLPGNLGSGADAPELRFDLPLNRTEYVNNDSGVQWTTLFTQEIPSTDPDDPTPIAITYNQSTPTTYRPGDAYRESWNRGVFGPVLVTPRPFPDAYVTRNGDTLTLFVYLFGDGPGREGDGLLATANSTVWRNGVQIGTQTEVDTSYPLPPDPARYRVQLDYTRFGPAVLSTRGRIVWTFRSSHVDSGPVALPVSVIRFSPALDAQNRATGDTIPVHVTRQPDAPAGTTAKLTVQVSYDDGAHWTTAPLSRTGADGVARYTHPAGHGFVSLRATATDTGGNTVEETLIRAFRF